jgi:hypothetical protein
MSEHHKAVQLTEIEECLRVNEVDQISPDDPMRTVTE